MNFNFEGNYKSKRNINLGGNKPQIDKKSLLAKAQSERKARERERLQWRSALKIQSFYRGRQVAHAIHQQESFLLQQELPILISLSNQPFASVSEANVALGARLVSCTRQLLLLCVNPQTTPLYSALIGDLGQLMSRNIAIQGGGALPQTHSVAQLFLLDEHYDMDTKIWLLTLLVSHLFLPVLESDKWADQGIAILTCIRHLVDPTTYKLPLPSMEPRGIYLRVMTHMLLQDHLFHSLHLLLRQLVVSDSTSVAQQSDDILALIMQTASVCLENLHPPFDYSPSTIGNLRPPSLIAPSPFSNSVSSSIVTSPPVLTRSRLLDLLILEILSVPLVLNGRRGAIVDPFVKMLPFDDILQTILRHCQDSGNEKWNLEPDVVAGLLINLTALGTRDSGVHLKQSLISYCHVIQLLLSNILSSYLPDDGKKQGATHMVLDSDSEDSDSDDQDVTAGYQAMDISPSSSPTSTTYSVCIKAQLDTLYDNDNLDILLHQFLDLTFSLYGQQKVSSASSLACVRSVASLFVTFILRWPTKKDHALNTILYYHRKANNHSTIAFLRVLWETWLEGGSGLSLFGASNGHIIDHLQEGIQEIIASDTPGNWSVLYLLCEMHTRVLLTIGDHEFFDRSSQYSQLALEEMVILSTYLKNISFVLFWRANVLDVNTILGSTGIQVGQLRNACTTLLQQLHMRDSRRSFCPKDHWLIYGLETESFSSAVVAEEYALEANDTAAPSSFGMTSAFEQRRLQHVKQTMSKARLAMVSPRLGLLNNIPFVISFEHRVQIFRMFVANDRKRNDIYDFIRPHAEARIRRDHVFEDGFNQLYKLGPDLKKKIAILFIDSFGIEESGIDGGGVFKEFLTSLGHEAFDTDYGLFSSTPEQLLYPNPGSFATEASQLAYFEFLGLIIGKALYEGILLDVAFAEFFLKKCLGKTNYLDDLPSLDPELYKGLIQVKNFDGNVEDLCLDFTLTENGNQSRSINLVPNGSNILVTNENRIRYVYLVANYRLNIQIARQCKAFFSGLSTIVDTKWLRMFNQQELQVMLGGASIPINLDDLRQHCVYADYRDSDPTIVHFWMALSSFTNEERMKFVKFVTSCSRPPVLGFKELQPQLCIRRAGTDEDRLPTSSTCVNLLKLPAFSTYQVLREKLLYAINADAGFDLS